MEEERKDSWETKASFARLYKLLIVEVDVPKELDTNGYPVGGHGSSRDQTPRPSLTNFGHVSAGAPFRSTCFHSPHTRRSPWPRVPRSPPALRAS